MKPLVNSMTLSALCEGRLNTKMKSQKTYFSKRAFIIFWAKSTYSLDQFHPALCNRKQTEQHISVSYYLATFSIMYELLVCTLWYSCISFPERPSQQPTSYFVSGVRYNPDFSNIRVVLSSLLKLFLLRNTASTERWQKVLFSKKSSECRSVWLHWLEGIYGNVHAHLGEQSALSPTGSEGTVWSWEFPSSSLLLVGKRQAQ